MKKGISLISLIITIVVVIILAAIAIFAGFSSVDKARLAKFVHEVSEFQTAAQHDYLNRQTQLRIAGVNESPEITYSKIAGGDATPARELELAEVLPEEELRERFQGEKAYRVDKVDNIANWTTPKNFTGRSDEEIYLTEYGEVIITPGLVIDKDGEKITYINQEINTGKEVEPLGGDTSSEEELEEPRDNALKFEVGETIDYKPNTKDKDGNPKKVVVGGTTITPDENVTWKVWSREGNSIVIAPTSPVSSVDVNGIFEIFWANRSLDEIFNDVCKMYADESQGITESNIKSMSVEDLDKYATISVKIGDKQEFISMDEYRKTVIKGGVKIGDTFEIASPSKHGSGSVWTVSTPLADRKTYLEKSLTAGGETMNVTQSTLYTDFNKAKFSEDGEEARCYLQWKGDATRNSREMFWGNNTYLLPSYSHDITLQNRRVTREAICIDTLSSYGLSASPINARHYAEGEDSWIESCGFGTAGFLPLIRIDLTGKTESDIALLKGE